MNKSQLKQASFATMHAADVPIRSIWTVHHKVLKTKIKKGSGKGRERTEVFSRVTNSFDNLDFGIMFKEVDVKDYTGE